MTLAIKGHPTRGEEVIQLLEMLGGINKYNLRGDTDEWFVLNGTRIQRSDRIFAEKGFTLEEFEEKFPYKVGDKVITKDTFIGTITDIRWQGDIVYTVQVSTTGQITYPKEDLQPYKEENMGEKEPEPKAPILSNRYDYAEGKCGYVIPDGYEFDSIKQGFQTEIILKPKKPQYPKDYEGCCEVLMGKTNFQDFSLVLTKMSIKISDENIISPNPPHINSINALYKLIICRDAYWKIAGEEMGLGKPWKPDWSHGHDRFYCLSTSADVIDKGEWYIDNKILAFPTAEMRDTFYENFKDLIEQCKELL